MKNPIHNANFPVDDEGRTYHINTKVGQCANRIITVGDPKRAERISQHLDDPSTVFTHLSGRNFLTITGRYKTVPVSIVAVGMGMPMMDFFVRETRAVVHGPLAIIRLGSCGAIDTKTKVGMIVVPTGSIAVSRNYDHFTHAYRDGLSDNLISSPNSVPYIMSKIVPTDPELSQLVLGEMEEKIGKGSVVAGLNATADSFYSTQGRTSNDFYDENENLIKTIRARNPEIISLEMEDFTLFHLAASAKPLPDFDPSVRSIRAAAAMMVFADRTSNEFVPSERVLELEHASGVAVLDALTKVDMKVPERDLHPEKGSVWERMNR